MITAIVPARDEEAVIGACVESLAKQPEFTQILVVNDQSRDRTAEIVRQLALQNSRVQLLEAEEPPAGWMGKNNAVSAGARRATSDWLLFVDADVELLGGAAARALQIAKENAAVWFRFRRNRSPRRGTRRR